MEESMRQLAARTFAGILFGAAFVFVLVLASGLIETAGR